MSAPAKRGVCVGCGCTDEDCSGCVERTGAPCTWVAPSLCSACSEGMAAPFAQELIAWLAASNCEDAPMDCRTYQGEFIRRSRPMGEPCIICRTKAVQRQLRKAVH